MSTPQPSYYEVLESLLDRVYRAEYAPFWEAPVDEREWGQREGIRHHFAIAYAVLDAHRPTDEYASRAREHLLAFDSGNHFTSLHLGTAFDLLHERLSSEDRASFGEQWVEEALSFRHLPDEVPAEELEDWSHVSNHALCSCVYADYAAELFPQHADVDEIRAITDPVWQVWWEDIREFHEQASNYEGFSQCYLLAWADLRGAMEAFLTEPTIANMLERGRLVASPAGIVPPYGDSGHLEHLSAWIALFERLASETGSPAYKRAARDVFQYARETVVADFEDSLSAIDTDDLLTGRQRYWTHTSFLSWIAMAALWADADVPVGDRPDPAGRSRRLRLGHPLPAPGKTDALPKAMEDCQVALTGGPAGSADRRYALLSAGPKRVHDHADAGALQLFAAGPTTLLGTSGYLQQELVYHHAFYAQPTDQEPFPDADPEQVLAGDPACRATVETLETGEDRSRCRLRIEDYHGLPIDVTREVALGSDGGLTLTDRVTAHEPGYRGGPLFHAESIDRVADRTYELRVDTLRSMSGLTARNPPGSLRLRVQGTEPRMDVVELGLPDIYTEFYTEFPTTTYREVWQESYTGRQCLSASRPLVPDEEHVFTVRLEPTGLE